MMAHKPHGATTGQELVMCIILPMLTLLAVAAAEFRYLKFQKFPGIQHIHGDVWGDSTTSKLRGAATCATEHSCYGFNLGPSGVETVPLTDSGGPFRVDSAWMYYKRGIEVLDMPLKFQRKMSSNDTPNNNCILVTKCLYSYNRSSLINVIHNQ